jgi:integrative and conjugative element protein (TIGR02256 family)
LIIKFLNKETGLSVFVSDMIVNCIEKYGREHYPKEFGGIFSGCVNNKEIIIKDITVPEKFENSKVFFRRHAEDLNKYLEKIYKESDGKLVYLGEWHTHPNGNPEYSSTDEYTMVGIADNRDIKTLNPILFIGGISKQNFEYEFYIVEKNKLFKLKKQHKNE